MGKGGLRDSPAGIVEPTRSVLPGGPARCGPVPGQGYTGNLRGHQFSQNTRASSRNRVVSKIMHHNPNPQDRQLPPSPALPRHGQGQSYNRPAHIRFPVPSSL